MALPGATASVAERPPTNQQRRPDGKQQMDGSRMRPNPKGQYRPDNERHHGKKERQRHEVAQRVGWLTARECTSILNPSER